MSIAVICDPVGTIVHVGARVPALGALICAAAIGGGLSMTGEPDRFGGCGEPGGDLYEVVSILDTTTPDAMVCAVPTEPPAVVDK